MNDEELMNISTVIVDGEEFAVDSIFDGANETHLDLDDCSSLVCKRGSEHWTRYGEAVDVEFR